MVFQVSVRTVSGCAALAPFGSSQCRPFPLGTDPLCLLILAIGVLSMWPGLWGPGLLSLSFEGRWQPLQRGSRVAASTAQQEDPVPHAGPGSLFRAHATRPPCGCLGLEEPTTSLGLHSCSAWGLPSRFRPLLPQISFPAHCQASFVVGRVPGRQLPGQPEWGTVVAWSQCCFCDHWLAALGGGGLCHTFCPEPSRVQLSREQPGGQWWAGRQTRPLCSLTAQ